MQFWSKYRQNRVYRIIAHFQNGFTTGSGFFINKTELLTCFHVAFAGELRVFRNDAGFANLIGQDEHSKLQTLFNNKITRVEVELADNSRVLATLKSFDERYDIALFKVDLQGKEINPCILNLTPKINLGNYVTFGGFPMHHDYANDKTPFATHEGIVSSFIETSAGGEKYTHLQINSINLGGNSGAPLFKKNSRKVIGIINANMQSGSQTVLFRDPNNPNAAIVGSLLVPLSIAYATPLQFLKEKTNIFSDNPEKG